jgi:hypothetical protein
LLISECVEPEQKIIGRKSIVAPYGEKIKALAEEQALQ